MTNFDVPDITQTHRRVNGHTVTDVRWRLGRRGSAGRPGSRLIFAAMGLLAAAAAVLFTVSVDAQFRYVLLVKHSGIIAGLEAIGPDVLMAIFSLLGLGLAMAGQSARIERVLVLVCALVSAVMNYAAADVLSPRSVLVYVLPPLLLAVAVDRVIAVVRRHVLGDDDRASWQLLGKVVLYGIRFTVAAPSTASGLRRWVLLSTPLPSAEGTEVARPDEPPAETKKDALLRLYRGHAAYGDRAMVGKVAAELAPEAGMASTGSARRIIGDHLRESS